MRPVIVQKHFHRIIIEGKEVGYIQILSYSGPHSQIEYYLDDEYHNKGIMTKELGKYLEMIKSHFKMVLAVVKEDNLASIRVLLKNGFNDFNFNKTGYKFYLKQL